MLFRSVLLTRAGVARTPKLLPMPGLRAAVSAPPYEPHEVERKWQRVWEEKNVHRARAAPARPKFFANVPYPYVNGYQHLGFAVAFLRAEFVFDILSQQLDFDGTGFCVSLVHLVILVRTAGGKPVVILLVPSSFIGSTFTVAAERKSTILPTG